MYNDEDGFTHVTKKNGSQRTVKDQEGKIKLKRLSDESDDELTDHQLEKIIKFYELKATKFKQSSYFQKFKNQFTDLMNGDLRFDQVVCYGLGNFNKETISRKQLYFLICLKQILNCFEWLIYDPAFSLDEQSILAKLNFNQIKANECCRRSIKVKENLIKRTLFYMPHCHKFMFNNLLWSNWSLDALSNLYLIGNSFKLISVDLIEKNDLKEFSYIHNLKKLNATQESPIDNDYSNKYLFNDLSIHTFKTAHLKPSDLNQLFNSNFPTYKEDNLA